MDPVPAALFLPTLDSVIWAHCSTLYCSGWGGGAPIYPKAEPLGEAAQGLLLSASPANLRLDLATKPL